MADKDDNDTSGGPKKRNKSLEITHWHLSLVFASLLLGLCCGIALTSNPLLLTSLSSRISTTQSWITSLSSFTSHHNPPSPPSPSSTAKPPSSTTKPPSPPSSPSSPPPDFFVVLESVHDVQPDFLSLLRSKGFVVKEARSNGSGFVVDGKDVDEEMIKDKLCLFLFTPRGVKIEGTFDNPLYQRAQETWKQNLIWTTISNSPSKDKEHDPLSPRSVTSGFRDASGTLRSLALEFSYKAEGSRKVFHEDAHNQAQWQHLGDALNQLSPPSS